MHVTAIAVLQLHVLLLCCLSVRHRFCLPVRKFDARGHVGFLCGGCAKIESIHEYESMVISYN